MKNSDGIVCKEQKGFIQNINGCCEHEPRINFLVTNPINNKRSLYFEALHCKDAFGSVSYYWLKINLKNLGIS
jgi:hypothetical protein